MVSVLSGLVPLSITRYAVRRTAQDALHFTPSIPVHSNTNSIYTKSTQPRCNYSSKNICGVNEISQDSKRHQDDSNIENPTVENPTF